MFNQQDMKIEKMPFPKEELRFILENLGALAEEVDQTEDERAKAELIKAMAIMTNHLSNLLNCSYILKTK